MSLSWCGEYMEGGRGGNVNMLFMYENMKNILNKKL